MNPICDCRFDAHGTFVDYHGDRCCKNCYRPIEKKRNYGTLIVLAVVAALLFGASMPFWLPMKLHSYTYPVDTPRIR